MAKRSASQGNGVAPIWESAISGNYTPTRTCIGFYVGVAGNVSFTSNGTALTIPFEKGYHSGLIDSFQSSGTTATNIHPLVI